MLIKTVWLCLVASMLVLIVGATILFTVSSNDIDKLSSSFQSDTSNEKLIGPQGQQKLPSSPDPSYPAPAKKLHTLLTNDDFQTSDPKNLQQKISTIDTQIEQMNKQLQAHGIDLASSYSKSAATESDTRTRLNSIKAHMANRSKP